MTSQHKIFTREKIINKIGRALQVILFLPVKLPGKALNILKYLAIGVGVIESVIDEKEEVEKDNSGNEGGVSDKINNMRVGGARWCAVLTMGEYFFR